MLYITDISGEIVGVAGYRNDNYGTTSLAGLATALGALYHIKTTEIEINANSTYSFNKVDGTNFISCDGSWGIYGTRYNVLTTGAEAKPSDMRFSVSIAQNIVTLTNTHT